MHLDTTFDDTQEQPVMVVALADKKGFPITPIPPGFSVQFASSDVNIATVSPNPDNISAMIVAVAPGTCTITITAADPSIAPSDVGVTVTVSAPGSFQIQLGNIQPQ